MSKFKTALIKEIHPSPNNPRKRPIKKNDPSIIELSDSIIKNGLINPILVRESKNPKFKYELVSGERRFIASKLAGNTSIDIHVENLSDDQVLEIQIVENLQREDVHPMDESSVFQAMVDRGKTVQDIAERIGKSTMFVYHRLMLQQLIKEAQELLIEDQISLHHARLISRLNEKDQKSALKFTVIRDPESKKVIDTVRISRLIHFIQNNIENDLSLSVFNTSKKLETPSGDMIACQQCQKRTGYADTLFHDIQEKDRCLDRNCFKFKTEQGLLAIEKSMSKKRKVIRLSEEMFIGERDGLRSIHDHQVKIVKDDGKKTYCGIIWTIGPNTGKILNINITGNFGVDPEDNDDESNFYSEQTEIIKKAVKNIIQNPPELKIHLLKLTAFVNFTSVEDVSQKRIAKTFGWKLQRDGNHISFDGTNAREYFDANYDKMSESKQVEFILLSSLSAIAFDPYSSVINWIEDFVSNTKPE